MKPFLHSPRSGALHSAATPPPFVRGGAAPFIRGVAALFILCAAAPRAAAQCLDQTVKLRPGWNAVYLEVSPEADASAVFADWPVDSVGVYDPASFLATRQFSAEGETEGLVPSPIFMWNREYREASSVSRIPAGSVCICFSTNASVYPATVRGVPAAPRTTWHRSEGGELLNYFGFSVQDDETVAPGAYLAGFGDLAGGSLLRIGGRTRESPPSRLPLYANDKVADGEVLLVGSTAVSDWSGALWVSPMGGLDFGTNAALRTFSVRNDGGSPRTVALELRSAAEELDGRVEFDPAFLRWRDTAATLTNASWNGIGRFTDGRAAITNKTLAAGETWTLTFGLDRTALPAGLERGVPFGALLAALDLDGATKMKAVVPVRGESAGLDAASTAWPAGLWVADVALDTVSLTKDSEFAESGGVLKLRLPMHVDGHGNVRLLQRVVAAGTEDASGNLAYRLYAGSAEPPATATTAMRISSVVLPTETPVVAADPDFSDFSSGLATFRFVVEAGGATSILRHPYHPQHDGLRWDFATPAPSGDDLSNYKWDVKPETFSVTNEIALLVEFDGGEAAWNPDADADGVCIWSFEGLRREGPVYAIGPATVRRVSPLSELILE